MNKIKFSIITPTYNRASTGLIDESIKCVQKQKKGNYDYEHIIINDGSTDNTIELISKYLKKDKRIKLINQENSGTPAALRRGIKEATGDYIVILGDDDLFPFDSLFARTEFIAKNPDVDWFYGKTQWVGDDGKPVKTWTQSLPLPEFPYERMLAENFIQGGTTTIKKEILDKIEWPAWLRKSDDYFLAMELLRPENGYKLGYIDKVLYKYRRHNRGIGMQSGRSLKNKKLAKERWEIDNKIRKLHPGGLAYLSSELNEAWRENRIISAENEELKSSLKSYKKRCEDSDKLIQEILNSKGWLMLEKIRGLLKRER